MLSFLTQNINLFIVVAVNEETFQEARSSLRRSRQQRNERKSVLTSLFFPPTSPSDHVSEPVLELCS